MPAEAFTPVRFGNYVLVSQLGKGGMAEVYKAKVGGVQGFQKTVCIKRILKQHTADSHFVEMFVNEAKISARLSHPNIVQVHDLGEVDGEFFMAMEFVHGRDLLRVMRQAMADGGQAPPPPVCAFIAREMCRALQHAHDQRNEHGPAPIIHRDVSPQNVMISYDGIVKLVDFGIAKAAQQAGMEETRTGALKGKFAYMAPEQLDGTKASPQSDIFAVGVTLFEMLTARRLFKGQTDYDTLLRVKTQPIPPPSELQRVVPPELDRIVLTALARDPAQRYPRAAQMARDLEIYCATAGFTAEDMKDYMTRLFPDHEEVPDGVIAALPQSFSGSQSALPMPAPAAPASAPAAPASAPVAVAPQTVFPPTPTNGGQRAEVSVAPTSVTPSKMPSEPASRVGVYVAIIGAAVLLAGGGVAAVRFGGGATPAATPRAEPAKPKPEPADVTPAEESVELDSSPSGAEILDGPRVLGTTPATVKLTEARRTITVKLVKPGFEELTYTLSSSDVPRQQLKLIASKKHHSSSEKKPEAPAAPGTPKVKSFDDVDESGPKVKTIDE